MTPRVLAGASLCFALFAGPAAGADEPPIGHKPTVWQSKSFAPHRAAAMRFGDAYRGFLDANRTEREVVAAALAQVAVDQTLAHSIVFSADVTGAVNPQYRELYERKNATFLGSGVAWDQTAVHAELMAYVPALFDRNGITHQPSTWLEAHGNKQEDGTVLPLFTANGMEGLDVSIPLLSMHAPFELVSKADLYEGYRAYKAFLED